MASGTVHYNKGKLTRGHMEWKPDTPYTNETTLDWVKTSENPIISSDYSSIRSENLLSSLASVVTQSNQCVYKIYYAE